MVNNLVIMDFENPKQKEEFLNFIQRHKEDMVWNTVEAGADGLRVFLTAEIRGNIVEITEKLKR